jgi:hypothetical protein
VPFRLLPFVALAEAGAVQVPVARALLTLGSVAIGEEKMRHGLDRRGLGLQGVSLGELLSLVR